MLGVSATVFEHLGTVSLFLQKDSHTLYLEQELESLKVVLDIKNKQLHQQEKKLMEIDKLVRVGADENDCYVTNSATFESFFCFFLFRPRKM